jgi:hypothetical protein
MARLDISCTSSRLWVDIIRVLPLAFWSCKNSQSHLAVLGSRPLSGSSSYRTSGSDARTAASATFFFSPPLKW